MRRTVLVAALALLAALPTRATASHTRYDAKVAMSDGVRLDASLYVPAATAPAAGFPLIVRQHGGGSNKDNPYDTEHGIAAVETGHFALLMYSARGHGGSEGIFDFFGPRTTQDFSEMLDWVEAAHGAEVDTGNVGVSGYSQGGGESLLPAAFDARVKSAAVGNTFADLNLALNPNDCFKFSFATGIFLAAYKLSASRTADDVAVRWGAQWYTDTEDAGAPPAVPSTTEDARARSPLTYLSRLVALPGRPAPLPVFWAQSWEDQLFPGDHPQRVLEPLRAAGALVHYWFSSGGHAAGPDFPADLAAKEAAIIDWFEQTLRGEARGFSGSRLVDYWQRAPGEWTHKTAAAWPVPGTTPVELYARSDGTLGPSAEPQGTEVGTIVNDLASANVANDAITNEVARNVPGMGDVVRSVPESANPLDTVRFRSAPLPAPLEFTGAPRVVVPLRTSAQRVVQVSAKVWDVAPDGARTLVDRGCTSAERTLPGPPPSAIDFTLWPNSHVFAAGHAIELTLSAVDFPTFKPDTEPVISTIQAGARVVLPAL